MRQDSVDVLIRELIGGERRSSERDAIDILNHIAASSFYMGRRNIPQPLRDLMREHGYPVPGRGSDLIYHWAKHVLSDQQWTPDTTAEAYFRYAIDGVIHPETQLIVQIAPSGHHVAVAICSVSSVVAEIHRGTHSGVDLLVVYSADVGRIVSAYMVATASQVTSRAGTVWLRR